MQIVDNQKEFNALCAELSNEKVIYMDTEFYRRKTYYAKLCLVQIASQDARIIIDILAIDDLVALKQLLINRRVLKVFHAPEQDFDIFFHLFHVVPVNVFDTQIAASVAGIQGIIGYGRLCKVLLNINIDKTMQRADWQMRPLSNKLIDYALKDVEYLMPLHRSLSQIISDRKLWDAYVVRSQKLLDIGNYKTSPKKLMKRIYARDTSDYFQDKLQQFVLLREACAQDIDVPRKFCISDQDLILLCKKLPINDRELSKLYVSGKMLSKKKYKLQVFELCSAFKELESK
jgi:ribonuclease D